MTAFATHADLAARWRALSPEEEDIADVLLEDAAAIILDSADTSAVSADILKIVSCDMVRRAMSANGDSFALGSTADAMAWTPNEAAGGMVGNLWLTYDNRKLLNAFKGRYFTVRPDLHVPTEDGGYGD